jgi:hypothetical protein
VKLGAAVRAAALMVVGALPAGAQEPAAQQDRDQRQARFQIAVMEAALEQAVQLGAANINMQVQTVAPDMVFLSGAPRARGFRLRDYGVFFDVAVPVMRPSLSWTFHVLRRNDNAAAVIALDSLRRRVESIGDPLLRQELERDVRRVERELPVMKTATAVGDAPKDSGNAGTTSRVVSQEGRPATSPLLEDPSQVYSDAVRNALLNAMLEYSQSIPLAPNEWLTIAVRNQEASRRQSLDPFDSGVTVLRVRGSDLAAFHSRQITPEVARSRIEVTEH